jgi:hypothetical protein
MTEDEADSGNKGKQEAEKKAHEKDPTNPKNALYNFFFEPNGGPVFENWIIAALLSGALFWYMSSASPS